MKNQFKTLWFQQAGMTGIIFTIILSSLFYAGCEPETGGSADSIYETITTLTKTPLQIVDWTDSLWIHNADNTWESYNTSLKTKVTRSVASGSNRNFGSFLLFENKIWLSSTSGYFILCDLTEKNHSVTDFKDILYPESFTSVVWEEGGKVRIIFEGEVFEWNNTQFVKIGISSKYTVFALKNIGGSNLIHNFYYKNSDEMNDIVLLNSNYSTLDTLEHDIGYRPVFMKMSVNSVPVLVTLNETRTLVRGVASSNGYIPYAQPFGVKSAKEVNSKILFVTADGSLSELNMTSNGDLLGLKLINYKDLPSPIVNFWVYPNYYLLYLSNKQLIKVKK